MARRIRPTAFQGIYEEYDDEEQVLPPVPRANTAAEVAATTGPGLIRPAARAQTGAVGGGGRATADPRLGYAELAQRDAEARMRYDIQQQQLNQEAQQQAQRGYLDMIRTGSAIWEADADRARRAEEFERTGEESAYRHDIGREDEERRLQQQMQQRDYQFERQRQDEREQAINASNQRLYEFEQGRMPSQRDIWQNEAERQAVAERMEMESFYKARDFGVRQQQELAHVDAQLARLENDPNLAPWEKAQVFKQLKYKYDSLEAMKQQTMMKSMQQQDAIKLREFEQNEKLMNMSVPDRFFNRNGQEWVRQPDGKLDQVKNTQAEQQEKLFGAALKQRDDIINSLEKRRDDEIADWRKAYSEGKKAWEDELKQAVKPDPSGADKMVPDEEKQKELRRDREFIIRHYMREIGVKDWSPDDIQQKWVPHIQKVWNTPPEDLIPRNSMGKVGQQQEQQQQQPPPSDEWGAYKAERGYLIPPREPQADGAGPTPAAPAPPTSLGRGEDPTSQGIVIDEGNRSPQKPSITGMLRSAVEREADPVERAIKGRTLGKIEAIMNQYGSRETMPPGVLADFDRLLETLRRRKPDELNKPRSEEEQQRLKHHGRIAG